MESAEGAALGGAVQAKWAYEGYRGRSATIEELTDSLVRTDESTRAAPIRKNVAVYGEMQRVMDEASAGLRKAFTEHRAMIGAI